MKKERFFELVSQIDDDLLIRAGNVKLERKTRKKAWTAFGIMAACVCLIVGMVVTLLPALRDPTVNWSGENKIYSADDIADIFGGLTDGVETNNYTEVVVTDNNHLHIGSIEEDEYVSIYEKKPADLNSEEYKAFFDRIFPEFAESLGYDEKNFSLAHGSYSVVYKTEDGTFWSEQDGFEQKVSFSSFEKMTLDGETVKMNPEADDTGIISDLQNIKTKLFDIFDVTFEDAKVVRKCWSYGRYLYAVDVYFYNEDAHPLNYTQPIPVSDYISISFGFNSVYDKTNNQEVGVELNHTQISYLQSRGEYRVVEKEKKISLQDAENLLYKGYVFGNHTCHYCMESQEKISFEGYDFVGMEYVFRYDFDTDRWIGGIPFYAFYKKIKTTEYGKIIYAKTYVCAIEVTGYDEYFASQEKNHVDFGWQEDEWEYDFDADQSA